MNQTRGRAYAPPIAISERRVDVVEPGQNVRRWKLEPSTNETRSDHRPVFSTACWTNASRMFLGRTSKMSHDRGWRAACGMTMWSLGFHSEIREVARGVTAMVVGSGALLARLFIRVIEHVTGIS